MKIDVTYEKADILRLVTEDLIKKGIQPKTGAPVEYKGALMVKLSVDAESTAPEPVATPAAAPPTVPLPEVSMDDVLNASKRAEQTPPTFSPPRTLGKNESYEFPKE